MSGLFHSYEMLPEIDAESRREAALAHVKEILLMHGATEEEIDRAVADGVIDLFVAERMLVPSRRRYTRAEVAELTGMDLVQLERFWRALGFAGVDDHDRALTDLDLEAVRIFQGMQALGATETDTALQMARVIGSSMSRIAEAELVPGDMISAEVDPVMSAEALASIADETIPAMAKLLEFVWRRQVAAGIQRSMMLRSHGLAPGQSPVLAVGFADMVGFTLLSQHLSDAGAGRGRAALRGALPRHRDGRSGPGGQDDRRRGHVRGGQRRRRGPHRPGSRRCLRRRRPALRRAGRAGRAARSSCATATTSGAR